MSPAIEIVDRAAANARERERDRKAWNFPARKMLKVDITGEDHRSTVQDGLDWEGFSARYFPGSRRHNLKAIVAYGAYKRGSPHGSEKAEIADSMIREGPLESWEDEGGAGS